MKALLPARRILLALACAAGAASALQVQFNVTDKLGKPVSGARICLEEDASQCQSTDAQGSATASPVVGLRRAAPPQGLRFSARPGFLSIDAPAAGPVRVSRFDASGRRLEAPREAELRVGANRIEWPRGKAGLVFTRLEYAGIRYDFTGVADGTSGARIAALGKAATANLHAFTVMKAGYQAFTFRPSKDVDTAVVRLALLADTGIRYTGIIRAKLDSIDTAGHLLKYTYPQYACDGDQSVVSQQKASLPFWMRDGKWYFPAGNCFGVALTKSGGGFQGTWKSTGLERLPEGLFPAACDPVQDSVNTSVVNLFFLNEGGGWEIDLGSDSLVIRVMRRLCPGNQLVFNPAAFDGKDGHPLITANGCREVAFRNSKDEIGSYTFPESSDSLKALFTYGDKVCATAGVPLTFETTAPKACPETAASALIADTIWQACVRGTNFAQ